VENVVVTESSEANVPSVEVMERFTTMKTVTNNPTSLKCYKSWPVTRPPVPAVAEPAVPSPNVRPVEGMVRSPARVAVETDTPETIYFFNFPFLLYMRTDYTPQKFRVEYGPLHYPMEGFTISLKDGVLVYSPDGSKSNEEELSPTEAEWNRFWQEMDELGVWEWNPTYQLCCLEGTHWKIKIIFNELELDSSGENNYPDNFLGFWEALEELLGRDLKLDI
jgi:hypothetical protein